MKLKANFVGDWIESLKGILVNHLGYDISGISDEVIPLTYFNVGQRRIAPEKREVKVADTFICPENLKSRWKVLRSKIENGQDINSYLSKQIKKVNYIDSMLLDWGIHHFHLVENPRSNDILFAFVAQEYFYAIGIYTHKDWAKYDIVETVHRNWPEAISSYKIKGIDVRNNVPEEGRLVLRSKNVNALTKVSDGTVYDSFGGGSTGSGHNRYSVIWMDRQESFLENLQNCFESHLPDLRNDLVGKGYKCEPEIEAKLIITENGYKAYFPFYKLTVNIKLVA
jgi:hypothetical protein